jgi:hypothetical protein
LEIAAILKELWARRLWVFVGIAVAAIAALSTNYRLHAFPPKAESKSYEYGTAQTQMLVDSPHSPLGDLGLDVAPLADRASIYARFTTSSAVLDLIGKKLGVPGSAIAASGPAALATAGTGSGRSRNPGSERRGTELQGEKNGYRLQVDADGELPTMNVYAQAPTGPEAVKLAQATVSGLQAYVVTVQRNQHIPLGRRVAIRQLGPAEGGLVNSGVNPKVALGTFIAVLVGWCVLMLLVASVVRNWRLPGPAGPVEVAPGLNGSGKFAGEVPHPERVDKELSS